MLMSSPGGTHPAPSIWSRYNNAEVFVSIPYAMIGRFIDGRQRVHGGHSYELARIAIKIAETESSHSLDRMR
jgi:hypothetical protein